MPQQTASALISIWVNAFQRKMQTSGLCKYEWLNDWMNEKFKVFVLIFGSVYKTKQICLNRGEESGWG